MYVNFLATEVFSGNILLSHIFVYPNFCILFTSVFVLGFSTLLINTTCLPSRMQNLFTITHLNTKDT